MFLSEAEPLSQAASRGHAHSAGNGRTPGGVRVPGERLVVSGMRWMRGSVTAWTRQYFRWPCAPPSRDPGPPAARPHRTGSRPDVPPLGLRCPEIGRDGLHTSAVGERYRADDLPVHGSMDVEDRRGRGIQESSCRGAPTDCIT